MIDLLVILGIVAAVLLILPFWIAISIWVGNLPAWDWVKARYYGYCEWVAEWIWKLFKVSV
jgi:hypothetical protein